MGAVVAMDEDSASSTASSAASTTRKKRRQRTIKHSAVYKTVQQVVNSYINDNLSDLTRHVGDNNKFYDPSKKTWSLTATDKWFYNLGHAVAARLTNMLQSKQKQFKKQLQKKTKIKIKDLIVSAFDRSIRSTVMAIMQTLKENKKIEPMQQNEDFKLLQQCVHASCNAVWDVKNVIMYLFKKSMTPRLIKQIKLTEEVRLYCMRRGAFYSGMYASTIIQTHPDQSSLVTIAAAEACCRQFHRTIDTSVFEDWLPLSIVTCKCVEQQKWCNQTLKMKNAVYAAVYAACTQTSEPQRKRAIKNALQVMYYFAVRHKWDGSWPQLSDEDIKGLISTASNAARDGGQRQGTLEDFAAELKQAVIDENIESDSDSSHTGDEDSSEEDVTHQNQPFDHEHRGSNRKGEANAPKQERNRVPNQSEINSAHGTLHRAGVFGHFPQSKTQKQRDEPGPKNPRLTRHTPPQPREGKRQGGYKQGQASRRILYQHHGPIHGSTPTEDQAISKAAKYRHKEKGKAAAKQAQAAASAWDERKTQEERDAARQQSPQQSPPRTRKATTNRATSPSAASSDRPNGADGKQAAAKPTSPRSKASRGGGAAEAQRDQQDGSEQSHVSDSDEIESNDFVDEIESKDFVSEEFDPEESKHTLGSQPSSDPSVDPENSVRMPVDERHAMTAFRNLQQKCLQMICCIQLFVKGGLHLYNNSKEWKNFSDLTFAQFTTQEASPEWGSSNFNQYLISQRNDLLQCHSDLQKILDQDQMGAAVSYDRMLEQYTTTLKSNLLQIEQMLTQMTLKIDANDDFHRSLTNVVQNYEQYGIYFEQEKHQYALYPNAKRAELRIWDIQAPKAQSLINVTNAFFQIIEMKQESDQTWQASRVLVTLTASDKQWHVDLPLSEQIDKFAIDLMLCPKTQFRLWGQEATAHQADDDDGASNYSIDLADDHPHTPNAGAGSRAAQSSSSQAEKYQESVDLYTKRCHDLIRYSGILITSNIMLENILWENGRPSNSYYVSHLQTIMKQNKTIDRLDGISREAQALLSQVQQAHRVGNVLGGFEQKISALRREIDEILRPIQIAWASPDFLKDWDNLLHTRQHIKHPLAVSLYGIKNEKVLKYVEQDPNPLQYTDMLIPYFFRGKILFSRYEQIPKTLMHKPHEGEDVRLKIDRMTYERQTLMQYIDDLTLTSEPPNARITFTVDNKTLQYVLPQDALEKLGMLAMVTKQAFEFKP